MSSQIVNIAFYDAHPYDRETFTEANRQFMYNIDFFDFRLNEKTALSARGYDAVCTFVNDTLDAAVIEALKECGVQLIALRCTGYSNVDLQAAAQAEIPVVRIPAYPAHAVAEHAAAMLLSLTRCVPRAYLRTRTGNFSLDGLIGRDLHGLTAGIVGTGRTGKAFAEILAGLGMKITCCDVNQDKDWANRHGFAYMQLAQMFANADVISLHCPLTAETRHIVNENSLALMKRDAIIVNTGRGALIDTKALVRVLKKQEIGGVALEIYEEEDKYFFDDWSADVIRQDTLARLLTFPNVIVTPHQAFLTASVLKSIAETTLGNILAFQSGGELLNEIKAAE